MVALVLNPLAMEFQPMRAPPGLMEAMTVPAGPPGVHAVADDINDDIPPPPGLAAPPGLASPPGLSCPPGLNFEEMQESKCLASPPGKFAPPGDFSPPGMFAAAGPPGFFVSTGPPGVLSTCTSPPGVWAKDLDVFSAAGISTDAESDSESSADGSFSE